MFFAYSDWLLNLGINSAIHWFAISSSKGWFPLTRFWLRTLTHGNLNHVNKIEARWKVLSLNEKLSEVQLLRLRATFHALPLFCLQTQILRTYARTNYATLEINPKPATPNSCKVGAKWIQVCCRNRQRNLNTNNQNKLFPKYTKKVTKFGLKVSTGEALSVWLEFIDEIGEKFFCLQMQIRSCVTLFSWHVHK